MKFRNRDAGQDTVADGARDEARERLLALAARRIAIEGIEPEVNAGRFAAKALLGEKVTFSADIFGDGHDVLRAALVWRPHGESGWHEAELRHAGNDRWTASVVFNRLGFHEYGFLAWRDLFSTWRSDTVKKRSAGADISLELLEGRQIIRDARAAASGEGRVALAALEGRIDAADRGAMPDFLLGPETDALMRRFSVRTHLTRYERVLRIWVDRRLAGFGAWYELMPRSQGQDGTHGTFEDVIARLPYVRGLGFDVLYLPPIHPIGRTNRKGRNNSLTATPDDPGSPYAIGSEEGGHDAVHAQLGTLANFRRLVEAARAEGLEIALDFAIQCSPDHPWIREHPEWFDWRPDGSIRFAENPPKKYEDIVNVHFYRDALPSLWFALRDIVLFWIAQGVTIFRVDNPHTKPFPFWEWLIREVQERHPETIFLSEAFTRPKVMRRLAKLGFTQSYSYFTWRNTKGELTEYLTELWESEARHYMRPNFFANTPDINPYYLQTGGRPGFRIRLVLAATLAGSYGIYNGFEICEAAAVPGKEEYLDSEKYQLRHWDMDRPGNIGDDIRLLNRLRAEHPALQPGGALRFHNAWDDEVLCYARSHAETGDFLLFHVNLDPHHTRQFAFEVPLWEFGLPDEASIEVEDMLHGNRFTWHGKTQNLTLEPQTRPYAIWRLIPPGAPR